MRRWHKQRSGLTLVEMLVALALTVFIMAILSEAFVTGLNAMRKIKALADVEQKLRAVADVLRRDLQADHFEGARRLSQLTASGRVVPQSIPNPFVGITPTGLPPSRAEFYEMLAPYQLVSPELGYFSLREFKVPAEILGASPSTFEGLDREGRPVERDEDDELAFTVRLPSNDPGNWMDARVPTGDLLDDYGTVNSRFDYVNNGRYLSQCFEVYYFLRHDEQRYGTLTGAAPALVSTFNLYRRQLAVPADNAAVQNILATPGVPPGVPLGVPVTPSPFSAARLIGGTWAQYFQAFDVSAAFGPGLIPPNPVGFWFNSMADVQFPRRRYQVRTPAGAGLNAGRLESLDFAGREGADLLLQNVISLDVKVWDPVALIGTRPNGSQFLAGAFVDIGHDLNVPPFNGTGLILDGITYTWNPTSPFVNEASPDFDIPASPAPAINVAPFLPNRTYDTGTRRNNDRVPPSGNGMFPFEPGIVRRQGPYVPSFDPVTGAPNPLSQRTVKPALAISAIQIKIRVFEPNTQQTREITIVVDM